MAYHHPKQSNRGRGALGNPANRFDVIEVVWDSEELDEAGVPLQTKFYKDTSRRIISYNSSPDIGFDASVNPYRGCEYGCVYCYARPTHEYYGLSLGLDFETQIMVKENAPDLLRKELSAKKWRPQLIAFSGVTDCYQPVERKLRLTRQCLEALLDFRNPGAVITKNFLVTRDIDILKKLAEYQCITVFISLSTLDADLVQVMEPRTARPEKRLQAIQKLSESGIPVGVLAAPVVPGLNDHEIPEVLKAAGQAGARQAKYILLRLPYGVKNLFTAFLRQHYPNHYNKVIHRIQHIRQGKLNQSEFGLRFRGHGVFADQIEQLFAQTCQRLGLNQNEMPISTADFRVPSSSSQGLFWE